MSSKLTIHDILDLAKRGEPVYVVRYWVERYFAMPARIIGWREFSNDHCLEIKVKFEIDGIEAFFYPEEIYSDVHYCQIEADAKKKKYGRFSILQAEYDELLEIKKKYEELIGGANEN